MAEGVVTDQSGLSTGFTYSLPEIITEDDGIILPGPYVFSGDCESLGGVDVTGSGLTLACRVRVDAASHTDARMISKSVGVQEADHWWMLSTHQDTRLRFRLKTDGVTTTLFSSLNTIVREQWVHVAVTYDGQKMCLYKDGTLVAEIAKTGVIDSDPTINVALGNQPIGAGDAPLHGSMEDVRILDRAISAAEIEDLVGVAPDPIPDPISEPDYMHGQYIGPHNTGWRGLGLTESDLTPHNGIFTEPGIYEGLDIQGNIQIRANNVTIRGFRVRYSSGTYAAQYYPTWNSGLEGATLEYGEIIGKPSNTIGVLFHGLGQSTRRLHIRGFRVGMHLYGNDTAENNYIEHLYYTDGSHNTSASIRGSNVVFRGNHLTDGNSAALAIYPDSPIHNVDVIDNFWQTPNAHYCANFGIGGPKDGASESSHIRVIDNIWGQDYSPKCGHSGTHHNWVSDRPGNEWYDNRLADGTSVD